jgi:cystathionine beta-lyase
MQNWFKTLNRKKTDSIKWDLAEKECQGTDCCLFSIADSDYETAPVVKEKMIERVNHGAFGYVNKGENFETIIKDWYDRRFSVKIDEKMIVSTPSVLNSISVVIQTLTQKNDGIIIQSPVYHMFREVIKHNDRQIIDNPLKQKDLVYSMDINHLESLFKQGYQTLILCNPHNPVGRVWSKEALSQLVKIAKKYDVLLISDEIHADIIMPHYQFYSLAHFFNQYDQIIVISAPTKVFNIAGLQIAQMIIGNERLRNKIVDAYSRLHLIRPNLMALVALKSAYQYGASWVDAQNQHIYENYIYLKETLEDLEGFTIYPLEGTYLVWIKVHLPNQSVSEFVENLKKYGVFVSLGEKFVNGEDYIRFSLACSRQQLEKGLSKIKQYLNK